MRSELSDLQILKQIEQEATLAFKRVEEIDYRDENGQYVLDGESGNILGLRLTRRTLDVPEQIYDLIHLKVLDYSLAKVLYISDKILNLKQLEKLNLYNTEIRSLPSRLDQLVNLRNINIAATPIEKLPEKICNLTNLEKLTLWATKIRELPHNIGKLKKLGCLDISGCRLKTFPESIVDLSIDFSLDQSRFDTIRIVGTTIDDKEVYECAVKGKETLTEYFNSGTFKQKDYSFESKIVLLGNGASGKTCIMHALLNNFFDSTQRKTEGVDVADWSISINNQKGCVHIWDLGGQEVYWPLYSLFLSKADVYVIVLNGRSDEKPDIWLHFVQIFNAGSPVIIAINRIDESPRAYIDVNYYRAMFPNIKYTIRCSCKDYDKPQGHIEELRNAIINTISDDRNLMMEQTEKFRELRRKIVDGDNFYHFLNSNDVAICVVYGKLGNVAG